MSRIRTFWASVLLGIAVLWTASGVQAQVWQESSDSTGATDWNQRVLKKPATNTNNKNLRWVAPQKSADNRQTVRRTSFEDSVFEEVPAPKGAPAPAQPAPHAVPKPVPQSQNQEIVEPDATSFEPLATEGEFADNGECSACGGCGCNMCCPCEPVCEGWEIFDGHCGPWLKGLSIFAGFDGFKGSQNRGVGGSFGMNEGLNLARPIGDPWNCGYQIGANFVQSDFSSAESVTIGDYTLRAACRRQYFMTAGIFRRAEPCGGFQWGVAYDYLQDDFYQISNLQQIRSETGIVLDPVYEIGYYGVYGVATDRVYDGRLDSTDMFVGYIRRKFENGGDGRIWGGATGRGDGLIGVEAWVPLGGSWAMETQANYMIPKQGQGDVANSREGWGLLIQLVWYPGQNAKCQQQDPYRPLFNVANNSLFMVDRLAH